MRFFLILLLLGGISTNLFAQGSAVSKQEKFVTRLLDQQVKQQNSIKNSVSSILTRYPEQVEVVVNVALKLYPNEYKQIMYGALEAEPVLTCNVVQLFIKSEVAPLNEIVNLAISVEPAYIQEIMKTATLASTNHNTAHEVMHSEHSKTLMSATMTSYPKSIIDILKGTISAFPENVVHFVKEALLLFPDEDKEIISTAVEASDKKYTQPIMDTAMYLNNEKE